MLGRTLPIAVMLVAALLAGVATPVAADVFVNNDWGDDRATGRAAEVGPLGGPVRSIGRALELVSKGDRVVLADTGIPYRESICLSGVEHRGFTGRPFVIDGSGAVLDGTVVAAPGAWRHHHGNVFALRSRRLAYQQLFELGRPLARVPTSKSASVPPTLQPMQWALSGGEILLCVEQDRLPEQYQLRHAGLETGISLYNTEHVVIQNLIVQGFHVDGINAVDMVRDCHLVDVECRANGRSGISVGGTSRVDIVRANCYDNGRAQLRTQEYARAGLWSCDLDEQSAPALNLRGGSVTVDGVPYVR